MAIGAGVGGPQQAPPQQAQSSGGGLLESIAPLAMLAGLFAGGGGRRRGGRSGGGLLSMLMQQQQQEEAYRQKQQEQQQAYRMQFIIPMLQDAMKNGYALDESVMGVAQELGFSPEFIKNYAVQAFEKSRGEEVRRNAQYFTPDQMRGYMAAGNHADLNQFYASEPGMAGARSAQMGDIAAETMAKNGAMLGYSGDPSAAVGFQQNPYAAMESMGAMGPNEQAARTRDSLRVVGAQKAGGGGGGGPSLAERRLDIQTAKELNGIAFKTVEMVRRLRESAANNFGIGTQEYEMAVKEGLKPIGWFAVTSAGQLGVDGDAFFNNLLAGGVPTGSGGGEGESIASISAKHGAPAGGETASAPVDDSQESGLWDNWTKWGRN